MPDSSKSAVFSDIDWESLFQRMPEAVYVVDDRYRFRWVNCAMEGHLGLPRQEILGKTCFSLVHKTVQPIEACPFHRMKTCGGGRETMEVEIPERGLCLKVVVDPLLDRKGKFAGAIHYLSDVTSARRAERELGDRLLSLMNNIPGVVYRGLKDWSLLFIGADVERITGRTPGEFLSGKANWRDLIHPDDLERVKSIFREAVHAGKKVLYSEYRAIHKNGTFRWISDRRQLFFDEDEKFAYVDGLLLDISAQKKAEEELRDTHDKLQALIEASPLAIMAITPEGIVTLWNPAAESTFGWTAKEVLGKFNPMVSEEKKGEFRLLRERVLKKGGFSGVEITRRKKDGSPIVISLSTAPLRDLGGNITGIMALMEDIAERKHAEEELFESRQMLQLVLDNIPQRIFWKDRDLNYLGCNQLFAEDAGMDAPASLIGKDDFDMSWRETAELYRADDSKVMETNRPKLNFEEPQTRPDGSVLFLRTSKVPLHDSEGRVKGVLGMYEDITEWKKIEKSLRLSEEQLLHAQKMEAIGRLAGGVAHDFNNLLTAIRGYSDLLLLRLEPKSPMRREIEEIHKASERAAALTHQLLAFSRKQVLQPKVLDLNGVVANLDKMLRRLIGEDIDMVTILKPDLAAVCVDPGQIEQVIMNLVVNARDAMPGGGKVTIETGNVTLGESDVQNQSVVRTGPYVMLAISDTGVGMDEETKSRLFEPFFTTKEKGKGTGLGLSTVYGIVNQSGGHIRVSSEPGEGSTFKVYFPPHAMGTDVEKEKESAKNSVRGGESVLLVEDDETVRSFVRDVLVLSGYRVLEAADGGQALGMAGQHRGPIHLVVTDVVMPRMSGRQLADSLVKSLPQVKFLYMSGYTDESIVRHGVLEPGISLLQKPFTPDALLRKVREILDSDTGGPVGLP